MGTIIVNTEYCKNELHEEISQYATRKYYVEVENYKKREGKVVDGLPKKRMYDFLRYVVGSTGNNFPKYTRYERKRDNRNLDCLQLRLLDECFGKAPIYLDVEMFQRKLLLTSSKMFHSNEKSCLAIMVDRYEMNTWWTAQRIIAKIKESGGNTRGFSIRRVEECLNKHCACSGGELKLYDRNEIAESLCHYEYKIRLTDLINYVNDVV